MAAVILVMVLIDLFNLFIVKQALWYWPHILFAILFLILVNIKGQYQSA